MLFLNLKTNDSMCKDSSSQSNSSSASDDWGFSQCVHPRQSGCAQSLKPGSLRNSYLLVPWMQMYYSVYKTNRVLWSLLFATCSPRIICLLPCHFQIRSLEVSKAKDPGQKIQHVSLEFYRYYLQSPKGLCRSLVVYIKPHFNCLSVLYGSPKKRHFSYSWEQ